MYFENKQKSSSSLRKRAIVQGFLKVLYGNVEIYRPKPG